MILIGRVLMRGSIKALIVDCYIMRFFLLYTLSSRDATCEITLCMLLKDYQHVISLLTA